MSTLRKQIAISALVIGISLLWSGGGIAFGAATATAASPTLVDQYGGPATYPMGAYPYSGMPTYPYSSPAMYPYGGSMTGYPTPTYQPASVAPIPNTVPSISLTNGISQSGSTVRIVDFAFNPSTMTVPVGSSLMWTNTGHAPHTTTSDSGLWNSGTLQPGASFTQTFATAGTFTYHCMIHPNMMGTITVLPAAGTAASTPSASVATTTTAAGSPVQTATVGLTYPPGWNLVAGPAGSAIMGNDGPLYTLRASDASYETLPSGSPLTAGNGYWALFDTSAAELLPVTPAQAITISLPAGQYVLVGNPSSVPMSVSGADSLLTYTAASGYQATTVLQPGEGAWAFSAHGATLTMSAGSTRAG